MTQHTLLSINNLTVRHLDKTLFKNLNFTVNQGEHWALVGKSGSGKSALLQTIAGRFNLTGGDIWFGFFEKLKNDGLINGDQWNHQRMIAMVEPKHHFRNLSNTTDFYYQQRYNSSDSEDALTIAQYLETIPAPLHKINYWDNEKVISLLNLTHLLHKQIIKLSNGETKRLMLAAALLKNPAILLLDSPLTGLDVETRLQFGDLMKEITRSGITVIMATSPYEIPDVITHLAVLVDGAINQTVERADFSPDIFIDGDTSKINVAELQSLLETRQASKKYEYIVNMRDVNIRYGEKTILKHINWVIRPGQHWALLGPNGAGKSTLLSLINGDNPQAYANNIVLFDKKRGTGESIWDIKSKIGFMSPELHQYFPTDNSCLQIIESGFYDTLGLFRPSVPTRAQLALQWMRVLEIEQYARVLLKNIPASAQRLCLLARALIKNPDLLIFDEPCQGLDAHQQAHFKRLVDTICALSTVTLIYVTHYQHEIPDCVTEVLRLDKGRMVN